MMAELHSCKFGCVPCAFLESVVLFLLVAGSCLFGPTLYAGGGEMNSIVAMNLNTIKDQADLILIGNLEIVDQPNEMIKKKYFMKVEYEGKNFTKLKLSKY